MSAILRQAVKRRQRVRANLKINNKSKRVRLSVFRSNKNIYAQLIDDAKGITLASSSTLSDELKSDLKKTSNIDAARVIGIDIARKAADLKITEIVFDKGSYKYHGRIKALADAARENHFIKF